VKNRSWWWWKEQHEPDLEMGNKTRRSAVAPLHVVIQVHGAEEYAGAEDHARILSGCEEEGRRTTT
jgi:hypothetical protein